MVSVSVDPTSLEWLVMTASVLTFTDLLSFHKGLGANYVYSISMGR
jgi:hypothetical protein